MKIESEQNQQQFNQLEEERDQLLKKIQDMEQRQVLEEEDIELEVAENQASTAAATEQIAALSEQLRVQTEVMNNLTKEQNALRQERDMYKKKAEEIEQVKILLLVGCFWWLKMWTQLREMDKMKSILWSYTQ